MPEEPLVFPYSLYGSARIQLSDRQYLVVLNQYGSELEVPGIHTGTLSSEAHFED